MTAPTNLKVIGVAPARPKGPCFATPIFSDSESRGGWYQLISDESIAGFGVVDQAVLLSVRLVASETCRCLGAPPLYAFISVEGTTAIGEKSELGSALRKEFERLGAWPHLRHTIANFLNDPTLSAISEASVDAWERTVRIKYRDNPWLRAGPVHRPGDLGKSNV